MLRAIPILRLPWTGLDECLVDESVRRFAAMGPPGDGLRLRIRRFGAGVLVAAGGELADEVGESAVVGVAAAFDA
jgi:hypothetical protein